MAATASHLPLPLKSQWWCSCSVRQPSTIHPPPLPCPHRVQPTNHAFQTCPSKTFLNQHTKFCEPVLYFSSDYLPLQASFEPTLQVIWASTLFFIRLPAPPNHFLTYTPISVSQSHHSFSDYLTLQAIFEPTCQALWAIPVFFVRLPAPPSHFFNRHAKHYEQVPSFLIVFIIHQWLLWHKVIFLCLCCRIFCCLLRLFLGKTLLQDLFLRFGKKAL